MQRSRHLALSFCVMLMLILPALLVGGGMVSSRTAYAGVAPAHLFAVSSTWTEIKLTAPTLVGAAQFGAAVAADGANVLIGAPGDDGAATTSGAAYLAEIVNGNWSTLLKLTADDGVAADQFGSAVAFGADFLAIGARGHDAAGANAGAVYVFRNSGGLWSQEAKLTPSEVGDTFFGHTVTADGNRIAVGAPYRGSGATNSGAVYIFEYDGAAWQQIARLTSGSPGGAVLSDLFGWSVDIQGDTLVVGAYLGDRVYHYTFANGAWTLAGEVSGVGVQSGDQYGYAVALDGATLVVGAPADNTASNSAGAIYIFEDNGSGWSQQAKFIPAVGLAGSRLGWSVAVLGNMIAAGARESKGLDDRDESGSAYVYVKHDSGWGSEIQLGANDAGVQDHFGQAVAVGATSVIVGAPDDDSGANTDAGAVYAFVHAGVIPTETPSPEPTVTEEPTETPSPEPTETEEPTETPSPEPTETEDPTPAPTPSDDCMVMAATDASADVLDSGATITWDSSFRCIEAAEEGTYAFTINIALSGGDSSGVTLNEVQIRHTSPRPQSVGPEASVEPLAAPVAIPGDGNEMIEVRGAYKLVRTGAIQHANLHFCLVGTEAANGEPFSLGFSAHLRGDKVIPADETAALSLPAVSHLRAIVRGTSLHLFWDTDMPATSKLSIVPNQSGQEPRDFAPGCGVAQTHAMRVNGLGFNTLYNVEVTATNEDGVTGEAEALQLRTSRAAASLYLPSIAR